MQPKKHLNIMQYHTKSIDKGIKTSQQVPNVIHDIKDLLFAYN